MRRISALCVAILAVAGCSKSDDGAAADSAGATAAATAAPSPAPAAITAADVAGTWNFRAVPESGPDTVVTTGVLTAAADTSKWTMAFTGGKGIKARVVSISGDSLVVDVGPYPSTRRRGAQVTTTTVTRLQDGKLVGTTVAHYRTAGADSVLRFRFEATKAP